MRRWLAILLLVLLPTQMTWAAVAGYCVHKSGAVAAAHLGHHDHAAQGLGAAQPDVPDTPDAGQGANSSMDHGCGHCHGHWAGMLIGTAPLQPDRPPAAPAPAGDAPRAAHPAAQPERPQWARLA